MIARAYDDGPWECLSQTQREPARRADNKIVLTST
jgi:hypothetical protein